MKKTLRIWQLAGFLFTSLAGTLLHFAYDWSGQNPLFALFSPVNESIWEHMKLVYVPMLLFALVQHRFLKGDCPAFWWPKLSGILLGLILIPVLFYTYTGITGQMRDAANIAIFFVAVAAGYLLETGLLELERLACGHSAAATLLLWLPALLFAVFTFFPPDIPLFQDPISGLTGIGA